MLGNVKWELMQSGKVRVFINRATTLDWGFTFYKTDLSKLHLPLFKLLHLAC